MNSLKPLSHEQQNEATARRAFLSQVGKAAVTAPAIALLAAASATPAAAQYRPDSTEGGRGRSRNHNGPPGPGE